MYRRDKNVPSKKNLLRHLRFSESCEIIRNVVICHISSLLYDLLYTKARSHKSLYLSLPLLFLHILDSQSIRLGKLTYFPFILIVFLVRSAFPSIIHSLAKRGRSYIVYHRHCMHTASPATADGGVNLLLQDVPFPLSLTLPKLIMFSLSGPTRYFRLDNSQKSSSYPTEHFTMLQPKNPLIDVSELLKIRGSADFKAPKL